MMRFWILFSLLAGAFAALLPETSVCADQIIAGPMLGGVTPTTARVWLEIDTSDYVNINCYDMDTGDQVFNLALNVTGPPPFILDAAIDGLQPDHDYRIEVIINGVTLSLPPPTFVIHTAPEPGTGKDVTLAFGSCADTEHYPDPGIWRSIAALQPQAFIFAGNTCYLPDTLDDYPYYNKQAMQFILQRYDSARQFPGFQHLLRICPMYATWDDRDFGTPDSDSSFVFAKQSLIAFDSYWPNPGYGIGSTLGTFCTFNVGDVQVFLLDDRSFRRNPASQDPGVMLGPVQLQWLKDNLLQSRATFKLIVDGDQMLADYPGRESWSNFPQEQNDFIQWIFNHDVNGVVLLSGHRGFGELTLRKPDPGDPEQYPLYDLTSASLAAAPLAPNQAVGFNNPNRIGAPVFENNFGLISVVGPVGQRDLTLSLLDAAGHVVLRQTIAQQQLQGQ
jgi:alkaline phosphatase D